MYRHLGEVQGIRFNGAATFQLRIELKVINISDTTFRFNGAATFQLRIDDNFTTWHNADSGSFNGAATFQLRIAAIFEDLDELSENASMEPQLFSCGLIAAYRTAPTSNDRFNGAATFQLRIGCLDTLMST